MKTLLQYLAESIVDYPEEIAIEEKEFDGSLNLSLQVNPADIGKIIGKEGRTIKAIKNLLHLKGILINQRVFLDLVEPDNQSPVR
ncbi:MAG: KH domain-containing protein [Candidatus Pacebacteria bacterium]|nr:KH domain-containing protein [Candidatus Paceibacterota bacterium]